MDVELPVTGDPAVTWSRYGGCLTLAYRGEPLLSVQLDGDEGIHVTTRAYFRGYQPGRRFQTADGGMRYAMAWWRRWGEQGKREIDARFASVAAERAVAEADALKYPVIEVAPRKSRRKR
jgi:hypothetical protein